MSIILTCDRSVNKPWIKRLLHVNLGPKSNIRNGDGGGGGGQDQKITKQVKISS